MTRCAVLCGSAPDGFTQRKINEMHDFLIGEEGGMWKEKEIVIFPCGVTEQVLSFFISRLALDKTDAVFLYVCTQIPSDDGDSFWLCGNEIKKSSIKNAFKSDGGALSGLAEQKRHSPSLQMIFDSCNDFVCDNEVFYGSEPIFL